MLMGVFHIALFEYLNNLEAAVKGAINETYLCWRDFAGDKIKLRNVKDDK